MNDLALRLLEIAHGCKTKKHRTASDLSMEIWTLFFAFRDELIFQQAQCTESAVPDRHLRGLLPAAMDMLNDRELDWEPPDIDEDVPAFVAFALACLRWENRIDAGRQPQPEHSVQEVDAWLMVREGPALKQQTLF